MLSGCQLLLQVTAYRAGHVLGAAMFLVEIGGMKVLYTGDYSRLADRHLSAADLPDSRPDIGITFGSAETRHSKYIRINIQVVVFLHHTMRGVPRTMILTFTASDETHHSQHSTIMILTFAGTGGFRRKLRGHCTSRSFPVSCD